MDYPYCKFGNITALQSYAERWHDAHTRSYDSSYTSVHLHNFQPTDTLRNSMAKKDEDADLVVETRRTLRSRQLQHGGLTYSCWNSLGATNNRSAVVSCSGDGSFWRRRRGPRSRTTAAVVVQVPVQFMCDRLVGSAGSALLFACVCKTTSCIHDRSQWYTYRLFFKQSNTQ